jgi:hypothetical protein
MRFELPADIRRYVRGKVLRCVLPFAFLELAFALALIFFGHKLFSTDVIGFRILCYFLVLMAPFPVTRFPFAILDRSWYGEIVDVEVKSRYSAHGSARLTLRSEQVILLKIRTPEGEILRKEATVCDQRTSRPGLDDVGLIKSKAESHTSEYRIGDTVYHFYGLSELFVIGQRRSVNVNCVVCGSENPRTSTHCHHCGHTLLHTILNNDTPLDQGGSS